MAADLSALEAILGYTFEDRSLLLRALTHRSYSSELPRERSEPDNEQFEFFGDAVLGFVVSEALVSRYPGAPEGWLSRAKSHLVSARWLHVSADRIGLGPFLQLGRGEEHSGGRAKASLLADALEAIIAAIYLDGGMEPARCFVLTHIYTDAIPAPADDANYKGRLWERAGAEKLPRPEYDVIETSGPAHAPSFTVEARLGTFYCGRGAGKSKKAAEQEAARALLGAMDAIQTPEESA
jgi:ribonuclease III